MNNEQFKTLIPDEGIRHFITGTISGSEKFSDALNYYEVMDNIITLAFLYSFCCFLELRNSSVNREGKMRKIENLKNGNANSKRVINIFEKIYTDHPITDELIQFVLLDIQFDVLLGSESKLRTFFPLCVDINDKFNLTDYFTMINQYHISSRGQDYTFDELSEKLESLIEFFPFLTKPTTSLEYDPESGWYVFKIKKGQNFENGIIHTYGVIHRFAEGRKKTRFFYLSSIKKETLRYDNCRGSKKCILNGNIEENNPEVIDNLEINGDIETITTYLNPNIPTYDVVGKGYATQIYSINYKYIKHLALAISDALGRLNLGQPVYQDTIKELKETFKETASKNYNDDLDTLVLMLVIENSPMRVLNILIKSNQQIAFEIIRNLRNRLGNSVGNTNVPLDDAKLFEDAFLNKIKEELGDSFNDLSEELLKQCQTELKTDFILRIVSAVHNDTPFHFSPSLNQGLETLNSVSIDTSSTEVLYRTINYNLCSIIKRLTCFYAGVFGFGKHKIQYDIISEYHLPSQDGIREYQEKCLNEFLSEAKNKWQEIKEEQSVKKIIKIFLDLCAKCNASDSQRQGRSDESFRLHSVVGKYGIINVERFKKEIDFDNVSELTMDLDREKLSWWHKKAVGIIRFFATGTFENNGTDDLSRAFIRTINPIQASFYRINNSRDGYNSAVFFLSMDLNYDRTIDYQREINVLSEFNYDMNKKYYCLPNVSRSDDRWWIDPLLIECDKFDAIFKE